MARRAATALKNIKPKNKIARVTQLESLAINMKYWGSEPTLKSNGLSDFIRCLNWFNYNRTRQDAEEYIVTYAEANFPEEKNILQRLRLDPFFPQSMGWVSQLIMNGSTVPQVSVDKLNSFIQKLPKLLKVKKVAETTTTVVSTAPSKLDICIADIEDEIDKWPNTNFTLYNYLTANTIGPNIAKQIADKYQPLLDELNSDDAQVKEAYSNLHRADKRHFIKFITTMIEEAIRFSENKRKETARSKPIRQKKVKTADQILKKFKYLKADTTLQMQSIAPEKIIGASIVYLYNTQSNMMTMIVAKDTDGLNVKGTTVINYDEGKSISKKLRNKRVDVLNAISKANKVQRLKVLDIVNTAPCRFTNMTSDKTIIVGAYK